MHTKIELYKTKEKIPNEKIWIKAIQPTLMYKESLDSEKNLILTKEKKLDNKKRTYIAKMK